MQDILKKAASEELAENVMYLNGQSQPKHLKASLPNLAKIIAMRSVGVALQADKKEASVCTYGCNLEPLGNAAWGESATEGELAVVDEKSGIYAIAEYEGSWSNRSPSLISQEVTEDVRAQIQKAVGVSEAADIKIYSFRDTSVPKGSYELHIPVDTAMGTEGVSVFNYEDGSPEKLDIEKTEDNVLVCKTDSVRYVVVAKGASAVTSSAQMWIGIAAGAVFIILIGALAVVNKRKQKKK